MACNCFNCNNINTSNVWKPNASSDDTTCCETVTVVSTAGVTPITENLIGKEGDEFINIASEQAWIKNKTDWVLRPSSSLSTVTSSGSTLIITQSGSTTNLEVKTAKYEVHYLENITYPTVFPDEPITSTSPLILGDVIKEEFTTGYITWTWDGTSWKGLGRDFLSGGQLSTSK